MTSSSTHSQRESTKSSFRWVDWFLPRYGCFCFGLRSCVAVFAWCFATASFGCVILSIIFSARAYALDKDTQLANVNDIGSKKRELWVLTVSLLIYGLVSLPLGVLMLQGALQRRRTLIVPWLCGAGVAISIVLITLVLMRATLRWKILLVISSALGVMVFAWIHVLSLFYRLRPSPRCYNDQFALKILPEVNGTAKLTENIVSDVSAGRSNNWVTVEQSSEVEKKRDHHYVISQKRNSPRPVARGLAVVPLPHRIPNTRFERRKTVLL